MTDQCCSEDVSSACGESRGERTIHRLPVHKYLARVKAEGVSAGRFAQVPKPVILALGSSAGALALYSLLMTYVSFDGKSSYCFPSIKRLSKELEVSESTIRRRLADLRRRGLVEVEKRGARNGYTLMSYSAPSRKSDGNTTQTCAEDRAALHGDKSPSDAASAECNSNIAADISSEREPLPRTNQEEVQACTSFSSLRGSKAFQLPERRRMALTEQFGEGLVAAGIEHVSRATNVRNPMGLLMSFLENGGWQLRTKLKDYLIEMPDPLTGNDKSLTAAEIVDLVGGSKELAIELLEQIPADMTRLMESASNEDQWTVASKIRGRCHDALHFVRSYYETPKEKADSRAFSRYINSIAKEGLETATKTFVARMYREDKQPVSS